MRASLMRRLALGAAALALMPTLLTPPALAQIPAQDPAALPAAAEAPVAVPAGALQRTITLKELGMADGLVMKGFSQEQNLFFRLRDPEAVAGMTLALPYRTASAFQARRSLVAVVAGRPVATVALPMEASQGVLQVPVGIGDIKDGFLLVTLKYSGVLTEDRCIDERAGGDYLTFAPEDGLKLALNTPALGTMQAAAGLAPPDVRFVLPDHALTANDISAALSVAAGAKGKLRFGGPDPVNPDWSETTVYIGRGSSALSVVPGPNGPAFALGTNDPAVGGRLLATTWTGLAGGGAMSGAAAAAAVRDRKVTFRGLGADVTPQNVVGRSNWTAAFSRKQLPPGFHPAGVDLQVVAPPDQTGGSVVSAELNGHIVASARASWPGATQLTAGLPKGLATLDNSLIVSVIRQPRGGDCKFSPQGYPAQIMGSSAITLEADKGAPSDFNNLASAYGNGVVVRLPADAAGQAAALPMAALAVQRLVPAGAPIRVTFGDTPIDGPFIAIGPNAPAGSKPPVRFDSGRVQLATAEGRSLFDLEGLNRLTTAQLVQSANNWGVWLRPGGASVAPQSLDLDRGDVAFLDQTGINMAFSSTRDDLIDVRYPDQIGILGWLSQHRVWVILAVWLAATLAFLMFLQRLYKARRTKSGR